MKRKMSSLVLIGKRWFNRTCGNTYHSVEIIIDGKTVHCCPYANGWLPGREKTEGTPGEALWRYCERMGIQYVRNVTDVKRKKDL